MYIYTINRIWQKEHEQRIPRYHEIDGCRRSRQLHIYRNGKKVLVLIGIYQNTEIWQHFFKENIRLS